MEIGIIKHFKKYIFLKLYLKLYFEKLFFVIEKSIMNVNMKENLKNLKEGGIF